MSESSWGFDSPRSHHPLLRERAPRRVCRLVLAPDSKSGSQESSVSTLASSGANTNDAYKQAERPMGGSIPSLSTT